MRATPCPSHTRGRDLCRRLAMLAMLLLFAGCDGPKPGSPAGQLASLYSDSTRWCKKQRECKVDAESCAARWPPRHAARTAVAKLSAEQTEACLKATLALDACALKLSCEEFAAFYSLEYCKRDDKLQTCCFDGDDNEIACPQQAKCADKELRFVEQCRGLEQLIGK